MRCSPSQFRVTVPVQRLQSVAVAERVVGTVTRTVMRLGEVFKLFRRQTAMITNFWRRRQEQLRLGTS